MNARLQEVLEEIDDLDLCKEEHDLLVDMLRGIMYISYFIPKKIENQAIQCIDICVREKKLLDKLKREMKEKPALDDEEASIIDLQPHSSGNSDQ